MYRLFGGKIVDNGRAEKRVKEEDGSLSENKETQEFELTSQNIH